MWPLAAIAILRRRFPSRCEWKLSPVESGAAPRQAAARRSNGNWVNRSKHMMQARVTKWARLGAAALAGFCLGSGCSVRGLNAVVVGLQAAAGELNGRNDESFLDWLDNKYGDDINDIKNLFD